MKGNCLFLCILLMSGISVASEKAVNGPYRVTIINDRQMPVSVTATSNGKLLYQNRIFNKKSVEVAIDPGSNLQIRVYEGGLSKIWNEENLKHMNPHGISIRVVPQGEFGADSGFKLDQNYYK